MLWPCRGYKNAVKFFPHEARDLEPVASLLEWVHSQVGGVQGGNASNHCSTPVHITNIAMKISHFRINATSACLTCRLLTPSHSLRDNISAMNVQLLVNHALTRNVLQAEAYICAQQGCVLMTQQFCQMFCKTCIQLEQNIRVHATSRPRSLQANYISVILAAMIHMQNIFQWTSSYPGFIREICVFFWFYFSRRFLVHTIHAPMDLHTTPSRDPDSIS